jgi:hypothetical protein
MPCGSVTSQVHKGRTTQLDRARPEALTFFLPTAKGRND